MTIKVHITPNFSKADRGDGGIRRVWEAQVKHLPKYGIEIVDQDVHADVLINHGSDLHMKGAKPIINCNHGLYWSRLEWGAGYHQVNRLVTDAMAAAVAVTAPSEWVATSIRRGMLHNPEVVYHGVDYEDWEHSYKHEGYILWNKARTDAVSTPEPLNKLAQMLPTYRFLSTFGNNVPNVKLTGRVDYTTMKTHVQKAALYLATARETFGIGTLEAMAAGVPIVGWDWGGQSEIVVDGETGYLAPPGDYAKLAECVQKAYKERDRLSKNCIDDVRRRWGWEHRIEQYADLIKAVHKKHNRKAPKVSVVITAYNLDKYLDECIESVTKQTFKDWECIVIDDALSDSTEEIVKKWTKKNKKIKYVRPPENLGLAMARNFSIDVAKGKLIRHLDADDYLAKNCLELEVEALDEDQRIHIAYGHLVNVSEDGVEQGRTDWPPEDFNWHLQMAHFNQLPSCSMVRREVYERSGGYRKRHTRNEDAAFWCLVTSLGFRAKKVTQAVTYYHRDRPDSKGALEWKDGGEGDWTAWFPWRKGATSASEGYRLFHQKGNSVHDAKIVPFGAQGDTPSDMTFWHVHDYSYPVVSIIVTVGPTHEKYVVDALDSVRGQIYPDWEVIVVNDTGVEWKDDHTSPVAGHPYAKVVSTGGRFNAAAARNLGAKYAKGSAMIWMDADDYWMPTLLYRMVASLEENDGVTFSNWFKHEPGKELSIYDVKPFVCGQIRHHMTCAGTSILVPTWVWKKVLEGQGGWDEEMPGMEDWDFQFATVHYAQTCYYKAGNDPLFVYRFLAGIKREHDNDILPQIVEYMNRKWKHLKLEEGNLMCGCKKPKVKPAPSTQFASSGEFESAQLIQESSSQSLVLLEYNGPSESPMTMKGKETGANYRFGNNKSNKQSYVYPADAERFLKQRNRDNSPTFVIVTATDHANRNAGEFIGAGLPDTGLDTTIGL